MIKWIFETVIPGFNRAGVRRFAFTAAPAYPGPTAEKGPRPAPEGPADFPTGWFPPGKEPTRGSPGRSDGHDRAAGLTRVLDRDQIDGTGIVGIGLQPRGHLPSGQQPAADGGNHSTVHEDGAVCWVRPLSWKRRIPVTGVHLLAVAAVGLEPSKAHWLSTPGAWESFGYRPGAVPHVIELDRKRLSQADGLTRKLLESAYSALEEREGENLLSSLAAMKSLLPVPELPR